MYEKHSLNICPTYSYEEWIRITDCIADVACWHKGFISANSPNYDPPPGLQALIDFAESAKKTMYSGV